MNGPDIDDRSPIGARRRVRVGYLEDQSSWTSVVVETDRDVWVISRDRAICWPAGGTEPARTWPLILVDWLEIGWPLSLTLLEGGREVRCDDLGVVERITVEHQITR